VRDELREGELHVHTGLRRAEPVAVDVRGQRQVDLVVAPGIAEFVRGDEHRRQGRARLGLQEAEALGQFVGDQVAQRDVVDQADQLDVARGLRRRDRHRHVVGDHHHLGLEVDAVVLADHQHVVARAEEAGADRLVHQRIDIEGLRHLGPARPAHALDVRQVGTAVDELVGARQRRGEHRRVEVEHLLRLDEAGAAVAGDLLQQFGHRVEARRGVVPVLQRALQRVGHLRHGDRLAQVAAGDDQRAVAAAGLEGGEFH